MSSRIRTIKPAFWVSEQVLSCSPSARLLFIGMWNFCDDHGVHPKSFLRLKAEVFPVDDFTVDQISEWIDQLIENSLVLEYTIEGHSYWQVTGWKKHQRIDKPSYRYPLPLNFRIIPDYSSKDRGVINDYSVICPIACDEESDADRNGKDRNGKDEYNCEVETSPPEDLCDLEIIFSHWQSVMGHPHAKLDKRRSGRILQALKLGYSLDQLKQAINGCALTPYNMGKNDSGQKYDDICLILRDAEHIERFINNYINPPNSEKDKASQRNVMVGVI